MVFGLWAAVEVRLGVVLGRMCAEAATLLLRQHFYIGSVHLCRPAILVQDFWST